MTGIRRVITGIDQDGQAIFTSDGPAPFTKASDLLGGWAVDIWEMASIPPGLSDDGDLTTGGGFPKEGSLVFRMVKMPAESVLRANPEETESYMGGPIDLDSDDYGMHRSDTVDLIIILSGRGMGSDGQRRRDASQTGGHAGAAGDGAHLAESGV